MIDHRYTKYGHAILKRMVHSLRIYCNSLKYYMQSNKHVNMNILCHVIHSKSVIYFISLTSDLIQIYISIWPQLVRGLLHVLTITPLLQRLLFYQKVNYPFLKLPWIYVFDTSYWNTCSVSALVSVATDVYK